MGITIISYLQWNFKKDTMVNLSCYSTPSVQDEFRKKIYEICKKPTACERQDSHDFFGNSTSPLSDEDTKIVKILAPLTENLNAQDKDGYTPIIFAANKGHTEIVKILVPLTNNPNAPNHYGSTPIYWAAMLVHTEIVKILAPFVDNPHLCADIVKHVLNNLGN